MTASLTGPGIINPGRAQLRLLGAALIAVNVVLPLGMIAYANATERHYPELFWGERNAIAWFSSVQLLLIAGVAYANRESAALLARLSPADAAQRTWVWAVFALGFAFLSLDERFGFHEYLRDDVFRPNQLFEIPFLRPGDISLYVYLLVGLVLGWFLLAELRVTTLALVLFATGVGVAAVSVVVDTLEKSITRSLPFPDFWTSVFEEVGEIWAQMFFALAFLVLLDRRFLRIRDRLRSSAEAPQGEQA